MADWRDTRYPTDGLEKTQSFRNPRERERKASKLLESAATGIGILVHYRNSA